LGAVHATDVAGINGLNKLRNKFAHNVETKLTKQDEENLYNALSPGQRKMIKGPRTAETAFLRRLRFDIIGLIASAAG
jgi:hypothetical protein